jgi:hypothetical protein
MLSAKINVEFEDSFSTPREAMHSDTEEGIKCLTD